MSKADFETYIVVVGSRQGARYAERKPLTVPLDLATGHYEHLSDLQVREFTNDMKAEAQRRCDVAAKKAAVKEATGNYDPMASMILRRN